MSGQFLYEATLDSGETHLVDVTNQALVQWDWEANKKGWPEPTKAPMLWQTFIIWAQLHHDGRYSGDFKAFREGGLKYQRELSQAEREQLEADTPTGPTPLATASGDA